MQTAAYTRTCTELLTGTYSVCVMPLFSALNYFGNTDLQEKKTPPGRKLAAKRN
jgi:hypothetical protein